MCKPLFLYFLRLIVIFCAFALVGCASTRRAQTKSGRTDAVAVVDSIASASVAHSSLTNLSEDEVLHIVIEEYQPTEGADSGAHLVGFDTAAGDSQSAPAVTRRITIDRQRQTKQTSASRDTSSQAVAVSRTDTIHCEDYEWRDTQAEVNGTHSSMVTYLLLILIDLGVIVVGGVVYYLCAKYADHE